MSPNELLVGQPGPGLAVNMSRSARHVRTYWACWTKEQDPTMVDHSLETYDRFHPPVVEAGSRPSYQLQALSARGFWDD